MIMGPGYAKVQEVVTGYAKPARRPAGEKTFRASRTHRIETLL
jgi:hypothetical protein